jgi:hypothetical protein
VDGTGGTNVGGLVGYNNGTINNAYAVGSMFNNAGCTNFGGLVGYNIGTINNAYATGAISFFPNNNVGGLVGSNNSTGTINNSFWNTQTTGRSNGVGLGSSTGATGETTAQMMQTSTFSNAGWSISNTGGSSAVWRIYEGNTAPLLRSFLTSYTLSTAPDVSVTYNGSTQNAGIFTNIPNILGTAASGKNVGIYSGYYSNQKGYDLIGGNLTINPAALTVTGANNNAIYNGSAQTNTGATYTGQKGTDSFTLSGYGTGINASTTAYADNLLATAVGSTLANNYTISYTNGGLTIGKAALTVTAGNVTKTYDGTTSATGTGTVGTIAGWVIRY